MCNSEQQKQQKRHEKHLINLLIQLIKRDRESQIPSIPIHLQIALDLTLFIENDGLEKEDCHQGTKHILCQRDICEISAWQ